MAELLLESRFDLGQQVGRGAWAEVFRAVDRETGAPVAVKRLHPHLREGIARERFQREVRLLAQIQSEHVLKYVAEAVDAAGNPCLVVEWLEGEDLARRARRARLPAAVAIDIVRQIALALAALHDLGIVHRDVKPANVFVLQGDDPKPRVKLLDLGVARTIGEATLTEGGLAIGTPYYMAPEQATGRGTISARTDLFSLGVMLFELVAGTRPFTGEDIFAVLAKIVLQELPRLRDAVTGVPRQLDELCARAMAKMPEERFASALHFADALALVPSFGDAATGEGSDEDLDGGRTLTVSISLGVSGSIERRVVTALFARLRRVDTDGDAPEKFMRIAREHGGEAHPLLGRNFVAVFGGARTTGDEVSRAAHAALAMREQVPGVRLAISTGRALAGGAELTGDVIERGAGELERVEGVASRVRIDAVTARLLGEELEVDDEDGALYLRGVRSSSVHPPGTVSAKGAARTLVGKATPCVGRERELRMLQATFDDCLRDSVARAVLVTAPAGGGKSRLRTEFLDRLKSLAPEPLVVLSRGDSLTAGSPLGLLGRALRRLSGVLEGEPLAVQRAKIIDRLGRHLGEADRARVAPLLGEIASVDFHGARPRLEDAMVRGDRLRSAFETWLAAECRIHPVVLVLEDLHWGDVPSIKLVESALRNLEESPLFVLALARPEVKDVFPNLWADRNLLALPLANLSKRASAELVRAVLGDVGEDTLQLIVERADGNAFFLEELIRAVADGGREGLPDTVLGVVQARLDVLGPEAKRVLKAASIFGRKFWRGGVIGVLGGADHTTTVASVIEDLVRREIVAWRPVASFPSEDEYVFRHALVRECAYAMLAEDDRALGHHLAGSWLEAVGENDPVLLAEHFVRGHQPARALEWYRRGAQQALAGNDFGAAIQRADRAMECGDGSGIPLLVQAEARRWKGELVEASRAAVGAAEALPRGDAAWFHAIREAIAANGRLGRIQIVVLWAKEASSALAAPEAINAQIASLVPPAVHLVYAGEHERAAELAAKVEALVASGAELEAPVHARVHQMRAVLAWHADEPEKSVEAQHAALRLFEQGGDLRNACLTSVNLAFVSSELGQNDVAEDLTRRAMANAARLGLGTIAALALNNLGAALRNKGQLDEAHRVEERAIAAFAQQHDPRLEGSSRVHLAMIFEQAGHASSAEREARAALETGAGTAVAISAKTALARALLLQGRGEEALLQAKLANDELAAVGTIEEYDIATRLVLAEAYEARGDLDLARAALVETAERLRVKVARLRDPAARERMLRDVPDNVRVTSMAKRFGL